MTIESRSKTGRAASEESVGAAFLHETRETLQGALAKITHCLDQLDDEDLLWRQLQSHNSIQNIVLHLCGNLRQWIVHGVGGAPDVRDRPREFAERRPIPKDELLEMLRDAVAEADATLAGCPASRLVEPRKVQGFDSTILGAIFDSVSHFVGHTHQIVYITRLRLGDKYQFQWKPGD